VDDDLPPEVEPADVDQVPEPEGWEADAVEEFSGRGTGW